MDKIFLKGLQVDTIIGVLPWERITRQAILLDLEIAADFALAARHEVITATIDYHALASRLTEFISNSEYQLLETLAEAIAKVVCDEFHISWLSLRLSKLNAVQNCEAVGVLLERNYQQIPAHGLSSRSND